MIKKPPGIEDIFPDKITKWNYVLETAKNIFKIYNYKEIIIPLIEFTEVFARGLGDETDIVSKEMFSFKDRGDRDLSLRPEGTASVVRALVENGEYNRLALNKFFYFGPMFRAERPQKGRLRQFNQFGAELFGSDHPFHDFEVISLMNDMAKRLPIKDYELLLNSIGCQRCRPNFILELSKYYESHYDQLCQECQRRLKKNPLRLLDCKNKDCQKLKEDAPKISSFLCQDCQDHHAEVKKYLDSAQIDYQDDFNLVRGLDYYNKTTFEFVTKALGGQNAFAAGGRYDNLVEQFGGKPTPAIGFAAGLERILLLLDDLTIDSVALDAFLIHSGGKTLEIALEIVNFLRQNNISVDLDPVNTNFKPQFKRADREKAKIAIIIGEEELEKGIFSVKNLISGTQQKIVRSELIEFFKKNF